MTPWLGRNLWRKAAALVVAVGLWFVFGGRDVMERTLRIPLEFINLPAGIEMTGEVPAVVDVRVRGSETALSRMVPGELSAVVDLATARPGQRLFHVTADDVRGPTGVTVVQVAPSSIAVGFEQTVSKMVPVAPSVEGVPAYGYEVGTITTQPARVEVFGPAGTLDGLQAAITEPVSVAGASSSVTETVTLGVPDRTLRVTTPRRVGVTVEIRPAQADRIVSGVVVEGQRGVRPVPAGQTVTVTLKGALAAVNGVPAGAIRALAEVAPGVARGPATAAVRVEVPPGVAVASVDPPEVAVLVP